MCVCVHMLVNMCVCNERARAGSLNPKQVQDVQDLMPSPTQTMIGSQCMHTHTENRKQPLASAVNTFTSTALTVSDNALPASSSPPSTMPSLRCVVMHVSFGCVVMHVSLRCVVMHVSFGCVVLGVCVTRCLARFLRPQPTNPARLAPFVCVCVHAGEHPPDADADADGCRSEGSNGCRSEDSKASSIDSSRGFRVYDSCEWWAR